MYTYFLFQKFKPVHQQRQCNHKYIPQMQGFFTSLLIYFFKRRRRKWNSPIPGSVSIMSLAGLVEDPKTTPLPWEFSFARTLSIIKSKAKQNKREGFWDSEITTEDSAIKLMLCQLSRKETRRDEEAKWLMPNWAAPQRLKSPKRSALVSRCKRYNNFIWFQTFGLFSTRPDAWSVLTGSQSL